MNNTTTPLRADEVMVTMVDGHGDDGCSIYKGKDGSMIGGDGVQLMWWSSFWWLVVGGFDGEKAAAAAEVTAAAEVGSVVVGDANSGSNMAVGAEATVVW
nr:hypothetical protein [Tanacetum cinerariifolium]